jgi:hypothetical protein
LQNVQERVDLAFQSCFRRVKAGAEKWDTRASKDIDRTIASHSNSLVLNFWTML